MTSSQLTGTPLLLNLIGSPFADGPASVEIDDPLSVYDFAARNRIRLLCLDSMTGTQRNPALDRKRVELLDRYEKTLGVVRDASRLLDGVGLEYAFFKSSRPYREATVDLDILIFGDRHPLAVNTLKDGGYLLLEEGELSTTLCDETVPLKVDLYDEIGVSRIIYLDKDRLQTYTTTHRLEDGIDMRTLDSKADLLALMTHSIIKEQMYVLSEYFTTIGFMDGMDTRELEAFVELARNCHAQHAASTHLSITAFLHNRVHGFVPERLESTLHILGTSPKECSRLAKNGLSMPHRYSASTLAHSLLEKLNEPKARDSIISQVAGLLSPSFNRKFFGAVFDHLVRESY